MKGYGEMRISFCKHNENMEKVKSKIESNYPAIDTTINKCIGVCEECAYKIIARVDGALVEGDTPEELYNKLIYCINQKKRC